MIRRLLKDGTLYTISGVVSRGISLFLLPFYVRFLSIEEYGLLDLILLITNFINLTFSLEVSQAIARFVPSFRLQKPKITLLTTGLGITLLSYSGFLVFFLLLKPIVIKYIILDDLPNLTYNLVAAHVFLNGLFLFVQNNFRWTLQSLRFAYTSLIYTILNLVCVGVFVFYFQLGLNGILISGIISTFLSLMVSFALQKNYYSGVFSFRYAVRILKFSMPLILSAVAVYFSLYLDRILINSFLGLKELAVFGVAFRFAALVGLATTGFSSALTPLIYNDPYSTTTKDSVQILFKHFVRASLLFLIFLTFFSSEILIFLTTPDYIEANILIPLVTSSMIFASGYVFFPGLTLAKETGKLAIINVFSSLVNLILCFIFIKKFGVIGVAFSTLISSCVGLVLNVLYSRKYYNQSISFLFQDSFILIVSGLLLGVIVLNPWVFLDSFELLPFVFKITIFLSLFLMYIFLMQKEKSSTG